MANASPVARCALRPRLAAVLGLLAAVVPRVASAAPVSVRNCARSGDRVAALVESAEGVVVVRASPGKAAETAGLRLGDRLLRWEQGDASGPLRSPFDLTEVELEQGPRGPVRLVGSRGAEPLTVSLFPDDWGLEGRPPLPLDAAEAYGAARRALDDGKTDAALAGLRALRVQARGLGLPDFEPWLLLEVARLEAGRRQPDAVAAAVEDAVGVAQAAGRPAVAAQLLAFLGSTLRDTGRVETASAAFERALAVRRSLGAESVAAASLAAPIGEIAFSRGVGRDEKRTLADGATALLERKAPDSLALARVLLALGWLKGQPEGPKQFARAYELVNRLAPDSLHMAAVLRAQAYLTSSPAGRNELYVRAMAIQERLAPESLQMVATLSQFGSSLFGTGDVKGALEKHERALALVERIGAGSSVHANALNSLAVFWVLRGDLVQAESLYRRALEIDLRLRPESFFVAARYYNLGDVMLRARDFAQSEVHLRRALEILEKQPGTSRTLLGRIFYALGRVLHEQGRAADAETTLRRSIEVLAEASPEQVPNARQYLADMLVDRGRYDEAEAIYRQNLAETDPAGTETVIVAERHQALASFALRRGNLEVAERHHGAALATYREHRPGSAPHAESSHGLGQVALRRGQKQQALALFQEAVDALETQGRRLGGSEEARTRFRAHYQEYYRDLEELLLELGREQDAFEVVERSRARGLLALLATRDVALGAGVPEELEWERRQADAEHERAFQALQRPGLEPAASNTLRAELGAARRAQDDIRARIRSRAPRAVAMRDPEPVDLAGVRRTLDPGTLLLTYSLGARAGRVYAVGPGPDEFAVFALAAGGEALREEVRTFRKAIEAGRGRLQRRGVRSLSLRLTEVLLRPVADRVRRAQRLLIVPDGALHLLPFAALQDPSSRGARYLVESVPVNVVSSVTLYDTLGRSSPTGSGGLEIVGFGDPLYPRTASAGSVKSQAAPALARAQNAGLHLSPLPATRREIEALKALSAEARLWLGPEATEERAKDIGRGTRVVHFACHGFLDEQFPLESGLALTIPSAASQERENGLLQAWEVFEAVRVDADLVTLSACQTGLGREMAGEGLLGLAWAFQYAGARSVLASLWEVNDASTADLMRHFYRHLAAGVPKAEALRRAQVNLLRRGQTASPYFWAAFTLIGDGR